jgi:hypothetical protein
MRTTFVPAPQRRGTPLGPGRTSRTVALSLALLSITALTGCTRAVTFDPAEFASDPACAEVVVRLPDTVADEPRRQTDAQGTGAWGDPASVLLRCGVPVPGPTTERCVSVNGIDWIIDETGAPTYRFTTYGRIPAVEVVLDHDVVSGETALNDLSAAVSAIPSEGACTGGGDIDG